jgi:hypothetical protein
VQYVREGRVVRRVYTDVEKRGKKLVGAIAFFVSIYRRVGENLGVGGNADESFVR